MTSRENYLLAANGKKPARVPVFPDDCNVFRMDFWSEMDPETGRDFCNILWTRNEAGKMPDYNHKAITEISQWRDVVKFPDPDKMDWEGMARRFRETKDPDKVTVAMLNTAGLFLIPINMLGWEDTLCAIYEEPEELEGLIAALTDMLEKCLPYIGRYIQPDIVCTGDDFAAAKGPFVSRDTFVNLYGPYLKRLNDGIHNIGALVEFHCCGNCGFLIEEFLKLGANICQLPAPDANLLADKERYGSKLVITGGWDRHGPGSYPNASEEVVRESVHTAIDTYGKDGGLIFWDGGIIGMGEDSQKKRAWVMDELERYGSTCYQN